MFTIQKKTNNQNVNFVSCQWGNREGRAYLKKPSEGEIKLESCSYSASSAPGGVQHSIQLSAESGASVLYSDTELLMSKAWPFVFYYVCPRSPPLCPARYTALLPQQQTERKRQTSGAAVGDERGASR